MKSNLNFSEILYAKKSFRIALTRYLIVLIIFNLSFISLTIAQTPVGANGKLSVSGTNLVNKDGIAIQLRGMSSHGPQWFSDCYNFNALSALTNDWGIDVFRVAMYVEENGYVTNPEYWRNWIDNMVDLCAQFGVYCLIDWHVLTPGDPNSNLTDAKEFWEYMSNKHAGKDHVIYEICNEPNGIEWQRVKEYANEIIPIIRANDPSTIIIVGTPNWSQDVDKAAESPLTGTNLMYALHFYSGTHLQWLRDKATTAMNAGLALFVTEFGTSQASGDGGPYIPESDIWMDYMAANKISWCNWSFSDKNEISAALNTGACGSNWNNTSVSGEYIKGKILSPADSWAGTGGNIPPTVNLTAPDNNSYYEIGNTISISADVSDTDGTVSSVEFYANGSIIGTTTGSPHTISWSPTTAAAYSVTAKAIDNDNGFNTSLAITVNVVTEIIQDAYPAGIPHIIPGEIRADHYDDGGEGIAYHDADAVNKGEGGIRPNEGVDTEGGDGGGNIGYVTDDEWLEFTVNVSSTAIYSLVLRYASEPGGGQFHITFDGADKTGLINVGSTGSWGTYQELTVEGIELEAGQQVMKMCIDKGDFNFSTLTFAGGSSIIPVTDITISPSTLTINKGQTGYLLATITPDNATNKSVTWSTNNASVATVSSAGVVSGISEGSAEITANSSVSTISDKITVTVTDIPLPNYSLTVDTSGAGTVSLSPAGGSYEEGTIVTLTATPANGFTFENWTGDVSGTNNTTTLTMDNNKAVTANFTRIANGCTSPLAITFPYERDGEANLCLETSGTIEYINSWNADLIEINGVDITNNYTDIMPPRINGKYQISYKASVGWAHIEIKGSDNNTSPTGYSLTSTIVGQGTITPASGTYDEDAVVNITATPNTGWSFSGWGGDASGTSASTNVTMNSNKVVTATFVEDNINPETYTLTTSTNGNGSIALSPTGNSYTANTEVTLTATADDGYIFSSWSGDLSGNTNISSIIMNENKVITATFIADGIPPCAFEVPLTSALPSINNAYSNIHVLGTGPNLSNISNLAINWDLDNNSLWQFSINTSNGVPDWYVDLKSNISHSFNSSLPAVAISGSGTELDGDYWATLDEDNLILEEKTEAYTLYFSNSSTTPCFKSAFGTDEGLTNNNEFKIFPNPASNSVTIAGLEDARSIKISNTLGQLIYIKNNLEGQKEYILSLDNFNSGSYLVKILTKKGNYITQMLLVK